MIRSKKHKVSFIYGDKLILVPQLIYQQLNTYIKCLRPKFIEDDDQDNDLRLVFSCNVKEKEGEDSSTTNTAMDHSAVTKNLTLAFKKAKVFDENSSIFKSVSCTRNRFSVITELVSMGDENLDNIAHCFAKHGKEVCKKFYVQFFSAREAARLSWKCYQIYQPITKEEK